MEVRLAALTGSESVRRPSQLTASLKLELRKAAATGYCDFYGVRKCREESEHTKMQEGLKEIETLERVREKWESSSMVCSVKP